MHPPDETQALRDEIALLKKQLHDARSAIRQSDLLRAEIRSLELRAQNKRRVDGYRLPHGAYETLEDIGILGGARAALMRLWHKDCHEFRKTIVHLTKLEWDLRKSLGKIL